MSNMSFQRNKNATITYYIYLYISIHNVVAYWILTVAAPSVIFKTTLQWLNKMRIKTHKYYAGTG